MENPCLLFEFVTSRLGQTLQHKHFLRSTIRPSRPYSEDFHRAILTPFPSPEYIIGGRIGSSTPFITRRAPGVRGNPGGAIEVVINPNTLQLEFFIIP